MNTSDNSSHFLSLILPFFLGSRRLFVVVVVVVVVVVINDINICLALLRWSFGKLFGFRLTSCIQSSISIRYNNKNT